MSDFPPVSTSAWLRKIEQDLRGADYKEKLIWYTLDGLAIQPFYRSEDVAGLTIGTPGEKHQPLIRQDISTSDPAEANRVAHEAVARGSTALGFALASTSERGISASQPADFRLLIDGLLIEDIPLHFLRTANAIPLLNMLCDEAARQDKDTDLLAGSIDIDPIGDLAQRGTGELERGMSALAHLLQGFRNCPPGFNVLSVNAAPYHNAGASPVQELACILGAASEYLAILSEQGVSPEVTLARLQFTVPLGTSYFMDMAKLRALRRVAMQLSSVYLQSDIAPVLPIHAFSSWREMTLYNPHMNILRGTTAAAAALLGGCDLIAVQPFDLLKGDPSELAYRLARNIPLILQLEARFMQEADPTVGAYYVEVLTDKLARSAWALFQDIEARGGFVLALREGFIQQMIRKTAQQREAEIERGERVYVGTNKFPDADEEHPIDRSTPDAQEDTSSIAFEPLLPRRSTSAYELMHRHRTSAT